jgi:hypothetical protein
LLAALALFAASTKPAAVRIGDVQAVTPKGLVKYDGFKACGKTQPPFTDIEIDGVVSDAARTDRLSIQVRGSRKRVRGRDGTPRCDDAHLEPLGESSSESDVPGESGPFRQRIAVPRGEWPCALSVEVQILRGGQVIARASRSLALGPCGK